MKFKVGIALLAIYLIWGSTYFAIRVSVADIPPFLMAGTRFLIAGSILLLGRCMAGDPLPHINQWKSAAVVGLLLILGGNGLVSWAEQIVPSGIAALMIGSAPLFMVLVEAALPGGTRLDFRIIFGILIGFAGIVILIRPFQLSGISSHLNLWGVISLLFASFFWSVGSVYGKSANMPQSPLMATGMEMFVGGIALYLVGSLTGEWKLVHLGLISSSSWLGLIYLILVGSLVGFVAYSWLLRNAPVSLVSTYAYVNPVIAILLGAWLGKEELNFNTLIAALVIIVAVIFISILNRSRIKPAMESISPSTNYPGD